MFAGRYTYPSLLINGRHVSVDPAASIATYRSANWVFNADGFGELVESTVETRISGSFDLVLTTYIWDEDWLGNPVQNPLSETWVTFANVNLQTPDAPMALDLSVDALLTGDLFSGDSGACSSPRNPWTWCSGLDMPPLSSINGVLGGSRLAMMGFTPYGSGFGFPGITYTINGSFAPFDGSAAVPSPSPAWLMFPALLVMRRRLGNSPRRLG